MAQPWIGNPDPDSNWGKPSVGARPIQAGIGRDGQPGVGADPRAPRWIPGRDADLLLARAAESAGPVRFGIYDLLNILDEQSAFIRDIKDADRNRGLLLDTTLDPDFLPFAGNFVTENLMRGEGSAARANKYLGYSAHPRTSNMISADRPPSAVRLTPRMLVDTLFAE